MFNIGDSLSKMNVRGPLPGLLVFPFFFFFLFSLFMFILFLACLWSLRYLALYPKLAVEIASEIPSHNEFGIYLYRTLQ
jgi:hypothetical protein